MTIINASGGSGNGTGFKLGLAPNIFNSGTGTEADAKALLLGQQNGAPVWLATYQKDLDENKPSSVIIMYTEGGVPKSKYLQWSGSVQKWRELSHISGLRGLSGIDGKTTIFQYSVDGINNWTTTQSALTQYWRWSIDNGVTYTQPAKYKTDTGIDQNAVLPVGYYFDKDPADNKLIVRGQINGVDQQVFKFGSGEADAFKSNRIMGGFRSIKDDGSEYFLIRQSTSGDLKAVSVGNFETITPNTLVCGKNGWREARLVDNETIATSCTATVTTNSLGGTRLTIPVTAQSNIYYKDLIITAVSAVANVKYNTRIFQDNDLTSDHQLKEEFFAGNGLDKFKINIVSGSNTLKLSQSYPVPTGTSFIIEYDFDKVVNIASSVVSVSGNPVVVSKTMPITNYTRAELDALPASEKWSNRLVQVTDEEDKLLHFSKKLNKFAEIGSGSGLTKKVIANMTGNGPTDPEAFNVIEYKQTTQNISTTILQPTDSKLTVLSVTNLGSASIQLLGANGSVSMNLHPNTAILLTWNSTANQWTPLTSNTVHGTNNQKILYSSGNEVYWVTQGETRNYLKQDLSGLKSYVADVVRILVNLTETIISSATDLKTRFRITDDTMDMSFYSTTEAVWVDRVSVTTTGTELKSQSLSKGCISVKDSDITVKHNNINRVLLDSTNTQIYSPTTDKIKFDMSDTSAYTKLYDSAAAMWRSRIGCSDSESTVISPNVKNYFRTTNSSNEMYFNNVERQLFDGTKTLITSPTIDKHRIQITNDSSYIQTYNTTVGAWRSRVGCSDAASVLYSPDISSYFRVANSGADIYFNNTLRLLIDNTKFQIDSPTANKSRFNVYDDSVTLQIYDTSINGFRSRVYAGSGYTLIESPTGAVSQKMTNTMLTNTMNGVDRLTIGSSSTWLTSADSNRGVLTISDNAVDLKAGGTIRFETGTSVTVMRSPTAAKSAVHLTDSAINIYAQNNTRFDISATQTTLWSPNQTTKAYVTNSEATLLFNNANYVTSQNGFVSMACGGTIMTFASNSMYCNNDNTVSSGTSSRRWTMVYAVNGSIQTSDQREKTPIEALPVELLDTWLETVRIGSWSWLENDNGKHAGFIAQDVVKCFEKCGMNYKDWFSIQLCEESDRFSIVMSEILAIEAAAQRRKLEKLEAKLNKLGM